MSSARETISDFVKKQTTVRIPEIWEEPKESQSPYASYWYRAVACMLLSGRVAVKMTGHPNLTDVNRICKEANFNQHLFERIARFLVAAKVIEADRQGRYKKGPEHDGFWKHDRKKLPRASRDAVLALIQGDTGYAVWRPTIAMHADLIEFLMLFFTAFQGLAIREDQFGQAMHGMTHLPEADVVRLGKGLGIKKSEIKLYDWEHWLDEKGQKAMLTALYGAEWLYFVEHKKAGWVFPSPIGLGMLGIGPVPSVPPLVKDLKVSSNLAIFAGAGLDLDKLVPLFRYCKIKRIDQVYEFQVDRRRLQEAPAGDSAGETLCELLADVQPLPGTLADVLQAKSKLGGRIGIRWCSALVKPETPEALSAIREHPQLKGYLEAGAPPGYLLIKPASNPDTFARRCQALGFEVKPL